MKNHIVSRKNIDVLCILFLTIGNLNTKAQNQINTWQPHIDIIADSTTYVGDYYYIKYIIENDKDEINTKSVQWYYGKDSLDYNINYGPIHSSNKEITINNTIEKTKCTETFSFQLTFNKVGTFNMPVLSLKTVSGEEIVSKPFSVTVNKQKPDSYLHSDPLAVTISANKRHILLGDSVELEIKVLTNVFPQSYSYSEF